jgi:uncharacterized protein involved in exopolysaccharide biosynthesis
MTDTFTNMLTLPEIVAALKRHWLKGGVVAVGMLILVAAAVYSLPRTYQSEAKIIVKIGRETVTLDPTVSTGQLVSIYESRENELNSLLEVLRSREVLEQVIDRVGTDALLYGGRIVEQPKVTQVSISGQDPSLEEPLSRRNGSARQASLKKLEKAIEIWAPKRSSVIAVRAKAESPDLAQAIVAAVLDAFRDEHVRVNRTHGSHEFFVEQEKVLKDRWQVASEKLRTTKDAMGVASIEGKRNMLQQQLNDIESRTISVQADLASNVAKTNSLRRVIAGLPETTVTSQVENANGAHDQMRGSLYSLQIKEQELLSKLQPDHPQVLAVRAQVADLEKILAGEQLVRSQKTKSINPHRQAMELDLLNQTSQRDALIGLSEQLTKQKEKIHEDLRTLNQQEIELGELQRTVQIAETSYRDVAGKLEQTRLNTALEHDRISNVNVVQPATFNSIPVSPKRSMILMLAGLMSAMSGAMVPLGLAFNDRRLRASGSDWE